MARDLVSFAHCGESAGESVRGGPPRRTRDNLAPAQRALRQSRGAILCVAIFSGFINVLALAGSFYMLQIYDRILPSQSVPTLVGLTVLLIGLYAIYGALDLVRVRVMGRVGLRIDREVTESVFSSLHLLPLRARQESDGLQPIRDLDQVRTFLSGLGPAAFFDLPWVPLYLAAVYLLHPLLGLFAFAGAMLLVSLTALANHKTSLPMREAAVSGSHRMALGESVRRNAEVVRAMGLGANLQMRWSRINDEHLHDHLTVSDAVSGIGTISKVLRLLLQSGILGLGAYLVILGQGTAGTIIAASIIMARALAPIETSIVHWRGFVAARQSYRRLIDLFHIAANDAPDVIELPPPKTSLIVDGLAIAPPGASLPIIRDISFELASGDGLGIIGPSAAGKTTLVRGLAGVWRPLPQGGSVRLDGASLDQWPPEALGRHTGYLPQDVELLSGSVAENICRFDSETPSAAIIAAATAAGAHDMILHLEDGYRTQVGDGGSRLSAGQRQRVALARALYGDPFLVILDEPNSNLDEAGEAALNSAIASVRARGGIAIIVAQRPSALASVDKVLAMAGGRVAAFGPKDDVLRRLVRPARTRSNVGGGESRSEEAVFPGLKIVAAGHGDVS